MVNIDLNSYLTPIVQFDLDYAQCSDWILMTVVKDESDNYFTLTKSGCCIGNANPCELKPIPKDELFETVIGYAEDEANCRAWDEEFERRVKEAEKDEVA